MAGKQRDADSSNILTIIHAPDSLLWAKFFQSKLLTDNYNIPSSLHPPYVTPDFFSPTSTSSSPSSSSSSSHKRLCALIVSPELLEPSHTEFWASYVQHQKGPSVAILLGVQKQDLIEALGKSQSASVLAQPCVEVVDRERATISLALVKLIEMYEATERLRLRKDLAQESFEEDEEEEFEEEEVEEEVGEEEEESLEETLERTKKYEGEEGGESPYMDPPPPRQQNDIMKVMPTVLYQGVGSREVMVVMRREAEKELTMVLQSKEGPPLQHLPLQHVVSSTYVATMPNDIHGRVAFCVMSGEHTIGCASVCIRSRLDLLQALLAREISPVALLCQAVGQTEAETTTTSTTVRDFQIEKLDKVLARRLSLSQLPPGLMGLLNAEELETSAEQEPEYNNQSQWPTLLHFAAEFNLVRVCEALLEYPGMIHAACTENVQGLFPCMVAERRGFKSLHSRLVQYVEEMSTHAGQRKRPTDSGVSFPPETLPPPKPHGSHSPSYVNEVVRATAYHPPTTPDAEEDVDALGMLYATSKKRSFSEGCVKTPYLRPPSEDIIAEEEDGCDTTTSPPALKPKLARARSDLHERVLPATHNRPLPPRPTDHSDSRHSLTRSEQNNSQQSSSRTIYPDLNAPYSPTSREAVIPAQGETQGKDSDVTSVVKPWRVEGFDESRRGSLATGSSKSQYGYETLTEEEATILRKTKRNKSLQEKLSHFFHKMKPRSHRSSSETNLAALGKGQKKTTVYVRASTTSTRSDPTSYSSFSLPCSMSSGWMANERDSGAVFDEKSSTVQLRSKKKSKIQHTGNRKGTLSSSGKKRMSVRVQRAKAEDLSETPSLPGRSSSKPEDSRL